MVDVAASTQRHTLVDRTEPAVAEQAGFQVFGGGGEVAGILLVAEVAGFGAGGDAAGGVGAVEDGGGAGAGWGACGGGDWGGVD